MFLQGKNWKYAIKLLSANEIQTSEENSDVYLRRTAGWLEQSMMGRTESNSDFHGSVCKYTYLKWGHGEWSICKTSKPAPGATWKQQNSPSAYWTINTIKNTTKTIMITKQAVWHFNLILCSVIPCNIYILYIWILSMVYLTFLINSCAW